MILMVLSRDTQINIPYIDPALIENRQRIFNLSYDFCCNCLSCKFLDTARPIPSVPQSPILLKQLQDTLQAFIFPYGKINLPQAILDFNSFPRELLPLLHESYLEALSEEFSTASHEGDYKVARNTGISLLAFYALVYPPNYPQFGEIQLLIGRCSILIHIKGCTL